MIAIVTRYPAMKDSGTKWLGRVPNHWATVPLCALATPKSVTGEQSRELLSVYLDRGVIRFADEAQKRTNATSDNLSLYQAVDPGDFVLNNQQAWRGSVGVSRLHGIVSPAYIVLSLGSQIDQCFANYLFRSSIMVAQYRVCSRGVGSIQRNLYWPHLKRVVVPLPPLKEQRNIVRFLNSDERRIGRYVRAKQDLISVLEEQKRAIVNQAVMGQIDVRTGRSYSAYKASDVEWLGEVPTHWSITSVRRLFRAITRRDLRGDEPLMSMSRHLGLVRSSDLGGRSNVESDSLVYPGLFGAP